LNEYYNKGRKQVSNPEASDKTDKAANAAIEKADDEASKIIYTGLIAQEVEEAAKKLNFEFSGVDKPEAKDGLYGLRYDNFVVPLVKAVQELSKQNEELQNRVETLETLLSKPGNNSKASQDISLTRASLEQNIPNPFNHTTTINYTLPKQFTNGQILITDQNGNVFKRTNVSGTGKGTLNIDAGAFSSGMYTYSLVVDGHVIDSKKMVLTK